MKRVWGADKNPRMLLLADLNMRHLADVVFHRRLMDSLSGSSTEGQTWLSPNSVDSVLTNPPFGVVLDAATYDLGQFETCRMPSGEVRKKQQSEVVFVEQCLRLLKPGGTLAIVLPRSVITNARLEAARAALDKLGYVYSVVTLPPETFHTTGTQTTTVVLFARRYQEREDLEEKLRIGVANVTNVGFDSTGRTRDANQLPQVARDLRETFATTSEKGTCKLLPPVTKGSTFSKLADLLSGRSRTTSSKKLRDLLEIARTGKTPARSSYTSEGLFVVKVGNLTGKGISWLPRERNFVTMPNETLQSNRKMTLLQEGDILLTASAHSPVYIAKKMDIVTRVPSWVGGVASLVGEVMLLRPKKDIVDPFALLAYLRLPTTIEEIQRQVRGQTAHLHPEDILDLPVPATILRPAGNLQLLADNLREEVKLNERVNATAYEQTRLLKILTEG
jgi:type I restriction enzyme M protein